MKRAWIVLPVLMLSVLIVGMQNVYAQQSAQLVVDNDGQLTGINNLSVDGVSYNVTFEEGTCISQYDGCDQVSDFDFTDATSAASAGQAILDAIDGTTWDDVPGNILGCDIVLSPAICLPIIPFGFPSSPSYPDEFSIAIVYNFATGYDPDRIEIGTNNRTTDMGPGSPNIVFAQFEEVIDSDGDGVPDDQDPFPNSNVDPTVVIDGRDTGVANVGSGVCAALDVGSTFSDQIAQAADSSTNHGEFVSAVSQLASDWKKSGCISGKEKGAITSAAAKANLP